MCVHYYMQVVVCLCVCTIACMWKPEDGLRELLLSFHRVSSRIWTYTLRLATSGLTHWTILPTGLEPLKTSTLKSLADTSAVTSSFLWCYEALSLWSHHSADLPVFHLSLPCFLQKLGHMYPWSFLTVFARLLCFMWVSKWIFFASVEAVYNKHYDGLTNISVLAMGKLLYSWHEFVALKADALGSCGSTEFCLEWQSSIAQYHLLWGSWECCLQPVPTQQESFWGDTSSFFSDLLSSLFPLVCSQTPVLFFACSLPIALLLWVWVGASGSPRETGVSI